MRHEPDDGPLLVADASDVPHRAVRIRTGRHFARLRRVPEDDLVALLELAEEGGLHVVAPLSVGDGHLEDLSAPEPASEWALGLLDDDVGPLAAELEALVSEERPRQETAPAEDLE